MDGILTGEYCGKCHGKVAFEPEVGCARCHTALRAAQRRTTAAHLDQARTEPLANGEEALLRGGELYEANCQVCHGTEGDGDGRLAPHVATKPRDFTTGSSSSDRRSAPPLQPISTSSGRSLAVLRERPCPHGRRSRSTTVALVHYIKTFSDRFEREPEGTPVDIPIVPEFTAELIESGKELYQGAGCHNCHGETGRGDGPSAAGLTDDWGQPIEVFDLTGGRVPKNGGEPEDFYRLILTGLPGTPMPGFGLALQPEQTWAITSYLLSLGDGDRRPLAVRGDIHFERAPQQKGEASARGPRRRLSRRIRVLRIHRSGDATRGLSALVPPDPNQVLVLSSRYLRDGGRSQTASRWTRFAGVSSAPPATTEPSPGRSASKAACAVMLSRRLPTAVVIAIALSTPASGDQIFQLGRWSGFVEMSYDRTDEVVSIGGADGSSTRPLFDRGRLEQKLGFRNRLTVLDPSVLVVHYGLTLGFLQSDFSAERGESSDDGRLTGYDITAGFFPQRRFSLDLLANRYESLVPQEFSGTLEIDSENYGATLKMRRVLLPGSLSYRQSEISTGTSVDPLLRGRDERRRTLQYLGARDWKAPPPPDQLRVLGARRSPLLGARPHALPRLSPSHL